MPIRSKASATDRVFGALANPTRRDILDALLTTHQSAGDIAARFDMARPSVSEHLRVLVSCGLVTERRAGRTVIFSVAPEPLRAVADWLNPYERYWRDRLAGLSAVLAGIEAYPSPGVTPGSGESATQPTAPIQPPMPHSDDPKATT